jgi:threonine/homoserine/homoserine lactone efflux protein
VLYLAAFPQFVRTGSISGLDAACLVAIHIAICYAWFLSVAVVIEKLTGIVRSSRFTHSLSLITGIALVGFGVSFTAPALHSLIQ